MLTHSTPYPKTLQMIEDNDNNKLVDCNKSLKTSTNANTTSCITLSDALNPLLDSSFNPTLNIQNIVDSIQGDNVTTAKDNPIITSKELISLTNINQLPYSTDKDGHVIISNGLFFLFFITKNFFLDIFLPSIKTEDEKIELKAGSLAVLCRTSNGTYLKTLDGNLLNATNTIYDFNNGNNIKISNQKVIKNNNLEQNLIFQSGRCSIDNKLESNKIANEVIELD